MKASKIIERAIFYNQKIQEILEPINLRLVTVTGDENAHITYQTSDGFCIAWEDEEGYPCNTPLNFIDIDDLFKLRRREAINLLKYHSV